MQIIRKINTSAAIALDSGGKEVVVLGKGVGFPAVPYELTDLSRVERTFYDVDPRYLSLLDELPQPIVLASAEIAEEAEDELGCELNPNLPFTLADHLHFAAQRQEKGIDLTNPIAYDIKHLYPREYALGQRALEILHERADVALPDCEAINVALHLINAQADGNAADEVMRTVGILADIEEIVESRLHFKLDRESYSYSRFATHIRYLIQRLETNQPNETGTADMLRTLAREYPDVYTCARSVADYFQKEHGWVCSKEEILYLMMHIQRVKERAEGEEESNIPPPV